MTIVRVCASFGAAMVLAFTALTAPSATLAADLGYGSVKDIPVVEPSHRTWYLKGTLGVSNESTGGLWHPNYTSGDYTLGHNDIKSAPIFGVGVGLEYNRWLRFDVMGEYRGSQVLLGQDSYDNGGGCPGTPPGSNCGTNEITGDLETWVGLANAYIDVGTWRGVTPYVGGGVGFASVSVLGLKDVNVPAASVFYADDETSYNFAWALYAGLSYDVTPQFTMDVGYRYLDLGEATSGNLQAYDGSGCGCTKYTVQDITSHDLLVSARYRLDTPAPLYPIK